MFKYFIFHSKINQVPLLSILLIIHLNLSITNCKAGLTDNICDTTTESNQNTIILKQLIGDNSPFCGLSLSNTSNQSESAGTSTSPTTTSASVFYIYTNSITVLGNLGNRATSSSSCQTMQTTSFSSLTCTNHMAVVSYSAGDDLLNAPVNNAVPPSRQLLSVGGTTVAADWNSYVTLGLTASLQAAGVSVGPSINYWTSTFNGGSVGQFNSSFNCVNNTSASNLSFGAMGATTVAGNANHIGFVSNQACDGSAASAYLMCVCWN